MRVVARAYLRTCTTFYQKLVLHEHVRRYADVVFIGGHSVPGAMRRGRAAVATPLVPPALVMLRLEHQSDLQRKAQIRIPRLGGAGASPKEWKRPPSYCDKRQ